jgi:sulfur-oxidizing protein SoxY
MAVLPFIAAIQVRPAAALAQHLQPLVDEVTGGAPLQHQGMTLALPALAENGNSVALSVAVESPMTASDHVKSIHILSEKNPRPVIARFYLGPRAGRAEVSTRIRLAATQQVVALAAMSDGSHRFAAADVVVTVAACIDGS